MLRKTTIAFLIQVLVLSFMFGQKHDFNWVVGTNFSQGDLLNFSDYELKINQINKIIPFNITNTTMSSDSGNYAFSFNGLVIQDQTFGLMNNSDSLLLGKMPVLYSNSGAPLIQGSLSLPSQKQADHFLLFYWDLDAYVYDPDLSYVAPYHLYMSKIDRSGNGGLGIVMEKNILLISDTLACAGITATKHANGRDWWVVVPEIVSNRYHTLLISNDSMIQSFSQSIGVGWPPTVDIVSPAKFNGTGTKYYRFSDQVGIQIFDFDRCTGLFHNPLLVPYEFDEGYFSGFALSRSGRYAYITDPNNVYQYDLWSSEIESTRILIDVYDGFMNPPPWPCNFLNPELGPDGKIYMGSFGGCKNLHVINHPERSGLACDFKQHEISLSIWHKGGLPNIPNYRLGSIDGSICDTLGINNIPLSAFRYDKDGLDSLKVEFTELADYEPNTWSWNFGDGTISSEKNPIHDYALSGIYQACLTVANQNGSDTYCKIIQLNTSSIANPPIGDQSIYYAFETAQIIVQGEPLKRIQILDASGRILMDVNSPDSPIDLKAYSGGLYFWKSLDQQGVVRTGKFVKI